MAYDAELADRIRAVLSAEPGVTERRMFGGLAFLVLRAPCDGCVVAHSHVM